MPGSGKKLPKLLILICSFFIIGIILLALWNYTLIEEMKKSEIERKELKKHLEKIEILEKTGRNFIKDVLRHKAIALCFLELIGEYEEKYSSKEKQDCIQHIVITDESYGYKKLDAPLILAWLEKESKGDPDAVSSAGAKGLTQWMDYRAWKILTSMDYPGYKKELIFNPVVNLSGGLYYLNNLMNFWEWKGVKDRDLVLFNALCSYKWGAEITEELFNTNREADKQYNQYIDWILKRREYWAEKLKYWIDDAQKLTKELEEKKMP